MTYCGHYSSQLKTLNNAQNISHVYHNTPLQIYFDLFCIIVYMYMYVQLHSVPHGFTSIQNTIL